MDQGGGGMEKIIQALNEQLKTLVKGMQKQSEMLFDALAPIKKLPELIQIQTKAVQNALSDNIRAQVLIAIANQKGTLASKDIQIQEELQQVNRIEEKLKRTVSKIHDEKRGYLRKIDQETNSSVDLLDAPVMNLTRKFFMSAIHLPMAEQVIPTLQLANGVGLGSRECRKLAFDKAFQKIRYGLGFYKELLAEARERAAALAHLEVKESLEIKAPVIAVEYEIDGQLQRQFFFAPTANNEGDLIGRAAWMEKYLNNPSQFYGDALTENLRFEELGPEQLHANFCS